MDKKNLLKSLKDEDIKGFEEFIEGQPDDSNFLTRQQPKKESSFEHFTFLTNDAERLLRVKDLLTKKLPFSAQFKQSEQLMKEQTQELAVLKARLFKICDSEGSPYRKSLGEIFNSFFEPTKD